MWKLTFNFLLIISLFIAFGCRPPEAETSYNITKFSNPLQGSSCSIEVDDQTEDFIESENCQIQQGCQSVLDESENFLGCVPIPEEEEEIVDTIPPSDNGTNEEDYGDESQVSDHEENEGYNEDEEQERHACSDPEKKNHKVLVCHQTSNKKAESHHTICIAKNAWENAHKQNSHHEGEDYLGACKVEDLNL